MVMSRGVKSFQTGLMVAALTVLVGCGGPSVAPPKAEVKTPPPATAQTPQPPVIMPPAAKPAAPQLLIGVGASESVKVALLLPLTGPQAEIGQGLLNAASMAVSEMASERLTLVPIDTAVMGAKAAAAQAVGVGSGLVLGPVFAADVGLAAPVTRAAGIPMISYSSDIAVAGPGVLVAGFLPREQAKRMARYAVARGLKSFAALAPDSAFGHQMVDAFKAELTALNGQKQGISLDRVAFYGDDPQALAEATSRLSDYSARKRAYAIVTGGVPSPELLAQLPSLDGATPAPPAVNQVPFQAVLIPENGQRLHQIMSLLQQESVDLAKIKVLGTLLWADAVIQKDPLMTGAWYAAPSPDSVAAFETRYRGLFTSKPPAIAQLGYDTTALAAVLARKGGPKPFSPDSLAVASGFAGTAGLFRFLADNTAERGLAVMEIVPPGVTIVDPAPSRFPPIVASTTQ